MIKVMNQLKDCLDAGIRDQHLLKLVEHQLLNYKALFYQQFDTVTLSQLTQALLLANQTFVAFALRFQACKLYGGGVADSWLVRVRNLGCQICHLLTKWCKRKQQFSKLSQITLISLIRVSVNGSQLWLSQPVSSQSSKASRQCIISSGMLLDQMQLDSPECKKLRGEHKANEVVQILRQNRVLTEGDMLTMVSLLNDFSSSSPYEELLAFVSHNLLWHLLRDVKELGNSQLFRRCKWFFQTHENKLTEQLLEIYKKLRAYVQKDQSFLKDIQDSWLRLYYEIKAGVQEQELTRKFRQVVKLKGLRSQPFIYLIGQIYQECRAGRTALLLIDQWFSLYLGQKDKNVKQLEEVVLTYSGLLDQLTKDQEYSTSLLSLVLQTSRKCMVSLSSNKRGAQINQLAVRSAIRSILFVSFFSSKNQSTVCYLESLVQLTDCCHSLIPKRSSQYNQISGQLFGLMAFNCVSSGRFQQARKYLLLLQSSNCKLNSFFKLVKLLCKCELEFQKADADTLIEILQQSSPQNRNVAIFLFFKHMPVSYIILQILRNETLSDKLFVMQPLQPFEIFFQNQSKIELLAEASGLLNNTLDRCQCQLLSQESLSSILAKLSDKINKNIIHKQYIFLMAVAAFYLTLVLKASKAVLQETRTSRKPLGKLLQLVILTQQFQSVSPSLIQLLVKVMSSRLTSKTVKTQKSILRQSTQCQIVNSISKKITFKLSPLLRSAFFQVFCITQSKQEVFKIIKQESDITALQQLASISQANLYPQAALMAFRKIMKISMAQSQQGLEALSITSLCFIIEHSQSSQQKKAIISQVMLRLCSSESKSKCENLNILLLTLAKIKRKQRALVDQLQPLFKEIMSSHKDLAYQTIRHINALLI